MLTARKLALGRSLQQLRQAWIDAGQTARSRITGAIRPGLPPEDHHLVQRQIDTSKKGQLQSACLMANYRYRLKDIESNHEAYHTDGKIVCAKSVSGLLKT